MKILKGIVCLLAGLALCFGLTACDGKQALQNVITKTYTVTVQVEQYVTGLDASNVVTKIKALEPALKVSSTALKFVASKVDNVDVKNQLTVVATNLDTVIVAVQNANPQQVDAVKTQVLATVTKVKDALKVAGQYVGLDLGTLKARTGVTIGEIMTSTGELDTMLKAYQR